MISVGDLFSDHMHRKAVVVYVPLHTDDPKAATRVENLVADPRDADHRERERETATTARDVVQLNVDALHDPPTRSTARTAERDEVSL